MATWSDINYEYQLFRNGQLGTLSASYAPVQGTYPGAVVMAAPEDPPWPPSVNVTKEQAMNMLEGFAFAAAVLLFLILRGPIRTLIVLGCIAVGCYKYMVWKGEVAQFKVKEKTWLESRMWPPQNQQRYVVQNTVNYVG